MRSSFIANIFAASLSAMIAGIAGGQDYPRKPIRIVTSEAGGANDMQARLISQGLTAALGQSIVVENRVNIAVFDLVAKAPPDGYTLMLVGPPLWIGPLLQKVSYDIKDFAPITSVGGSPNVLVVNPTFPAKTVKELIALAKAKPGNLNYAASLFANTHLAAELFKSMANVDIVLISFKGSAPALNALAGNEVQIMFSTAGSAQPYLKSGKVRPLAVTSAQPSVLFPDLPTVAASGVPGYESEIIYTVYTTAKTPAAVVNILNREIVRTLNTASVKERFLNAGIEVRTTTPQQLAATVQAETARIGKLVKERGIKAE